MQNVVTIENRNVYDDPRDVYVNPAEEVTPTICDNSPNTEKSLLLEVVNENDNVRRSVGDSSRHSSTVYRGDSPQGRTHDTVPLLPHQAIQQGGHHAGSIDADASVCARMTSAGGRITLPNSGQ